MEIKGWRTERRLKERRPNGDCRREERTEIEREDGRLTEDCVRQELIEESYARCERRKKIKENLGERE